MPPRYSYWTILAGGLPTAFRATDREELLPTFRRLKEKHPDAEMKWFARGQIWASPEDARDALARQRDVRDRRDPRSSPGAHARPTRFGARDRNERQGRDDRRDSREGRPPRDDQRERPPRRPREAPGAPARPAGGGKARGRDWRPGGDHRDPRQPFKDAKKARNVVRRKQKFARKTGAAAQRPPWREPREQPERSRERDRHDGRAENARDRRPTDGGRSRPPAPAAWGSSDRRRREEGAGDHASSWRKPKPPAPASTSGRPFVPAQTPRTGDRPASAQPWRKPPAQPRRDQPAWPRRDQPTQPRWDRPREPWRAAPPPGSYPKPREPKTVPPRPPERGRPPRKPRP